MVNHTKTLNTSVYTVHNQMTYKNEVTYIHIQLRILFLGLFKQSWAVNGIAEKSRGGGEG